MRALALWRCILMASFLIGGGADYSRNTAGPYDIIFRHAESCPNVGTGEAEQTLKIRKLNRELTAIDANISMRVPFDDDTTAILKLAQFTNGGYKDNFYTHEMRKACSTMGKLLPVLQKEVFRAAKMGKCPVKPSYFSSQGSLFRLLGCYSKFCDDFGISEAKTRGIPEQYNIITGNYYLYNYTSTEKINVIPVFFYNKYRAQIIYSRFGKRISCIQIFAEIVPKKRSAHRRRT